MNKNDKLIKFLKDWLSNLVLNAKKEISLRIKLLFKIKPKLKETQEGFPSPYYTLNYRAMQELLMKNSQRFKKFEHSVIGGGWLLQISSKGKIAEETYRYLWYNLLFAVKNENDDAILTYWGNAFQFLQYSLREIDKVLHQGNFRKILNSQEVKQRRRERRRFKEFHYALGGLLIYKKRYNCIKRIFEFTNSEPPAYELFPTNMSEIICLYFDFKASYAQEMIFISGKYPFADMEGISSDDNTDDHAECEVVQRAAALEEQNDDDEKNGQRCYDRS